MGRKGGERLHVSENVEEKLKLCVKQKPLAAFDAVHDSPLAVPLSVNTINSDII